MECAAAAKRPRGFNAEVNTTDSRGGTCEQIVVLRIGLASASSQPVRPRDDGRALSTPGFSGAQLPSNQKRRCSSCAPTKRHRRRVQVAVKRTVRGQQNNVRAANATRAKAVGIERSVL